MRRTSHPACRVCRRRVQREEVRPGGLCAECWRDPGTRFLAGREYRERAFPFLKQPGK